MQNRALGPSQAPQLLRCAGQILGLRDSRLGPEARSHNSSMALGVGVNVQFFQENQEWRLVFPRWIVQLRLLFRSPDDVV